MDTNSCSNLRKTTTVINMCKKNYFLLTKKDNDS